LSTAFTAANIGRNQAAAAKQEQPGEIAYWIQTHSLEKLRLVALLDEPCSFNRATQVTLSTNEKPSRSLPVMAEQPGDGQSLLALKHLTGKQPGGTQIILRIKKAALAGRQKTRQ
jgi:hypothetical protein